jgi:hypothetical protein
LGTVLLLLLLLLLLLRLLSGSPMPPMLSVDSLLGCRKPLGCAKRFIVTTCRV